jgi:uncharacterized protein YjdB
MKKPKLQLLAAVFLVTVICVAGCGVTGISLNKTEVTIAVGETVQLTPALEKNLLTFDKTVTWSTDYQEVATVNDSGLVTGVAAGTAIITATTPNGLTAECEVTVVVPVEGVAIYAGEEEAENLELAKGQTLELTAVVSPEDATNQEVSWEIVSGEDKISIEADGGTLTVEGINDGAAVVKVVTDDGDFEAQCSINVYSLVQSISIGFDEEEVIDYDEENNIVIIGIDSALKLNAVITPQNAKYKAVTWSSSDEELVSVDSEGKITALELTEEDGEVTITVTSVKYPEISSSIKVRVVTPVAGVEIYHNNQKVEDPIRLDKDSEIQLTAVFLPEDATNKNVTWVIVEGEEYIQIEQNGKVKGIAVGEAKVKVITAESGYEYTCDINVEQFAESVLIYHNGQVVPKLNQGFLKVTMQQTFTLTAVVYPNDATNQEVIWEIVEDDWDAARDWTVNGNTVSLYLYYPGCLVHIRVTTVDGGFSYAISVGASSPGY